jgi:glycosyltransferase involved in cell wall biosynthesis
MSVGQPVLLGAAPRASAIRVLQFLTLFAVGGTERQVMNLALGIDSSRFDVHFACLKRWGDFLEDVEAKGSPLAEYPIPRLYGVQALRRQLEFARALRRDGIDIVHTYGFYPNVFAVAAARLARVPVIVASIRENGDLLTPAQRRVQRLSCRLADAIIVNAESVKRRIVSDGYDAERITVIRNGIDLARFRGRRDSGRLRRELSVPAQAPLVAVFARLVPAKGIEYFLQAAAGVAQRFPEARFVVVGESRVVRDGVIVESPYKRELVQYASRLGLNGRVLFTGFRMDIPEVLPDVTLSVLPSLSEGLPNSVLESMAAGVPVVATGVGGTPEAVQDGVSGLLVPPSDAVALERAICSLLEDRALAARLGRAAEQRVSEHFSNEQMVRRTERFYLSLLTKTRRQRRPAAEAWEGTA